MGVIPARVAGVREITVCSPPRRDTGLPSEIILAAAALAGADRVFAVGGAGAIGAMAYGTESIAASRPHRRPGERVCRGGEAAGEKRRRDGLAGRAE